MTDSALLQVISELIQKNQELSQQQTYLLLATNQLHNRIHTLEQTVLHLTKAQLERIVGTGQEPPQ